MSRRVRSILNAAGSFAREFRRHLKWIWMEHGTWATLWTAFGFGVLVAWPPTWVTAATLVGLSAVAAAKVLAVRVHRGQVSGWVPMGCLLTACAALIPLLRSAPYFVIAAGAAGALFLAVYFRASRSPQWTRTLPVELMGVVLMSAAAGLSVLSSRPDATREAALVWGLSAALFVPGVPRAKLLKARTAGLRVLLLGAALVGVAAFFLLALCGLVPWWGALAGLVFVGDTHAAIRLPHVKTRRLGMVLMLRNVAATLLAGLAWRSF
ncbi:MAG: hypothetical protein P8099_00815 [Gemmatimonadota bacterium]